MSPPKQRFTWPSAAPLRVLKYHPTTTHILPDNDLPRIPAPQRSSHRHRGSRHASTPTQPHPMSPTHDQRGPARRSARCGRLAAPFPLPVTALARSLPSTPSGVAALLRAWIRGIAVLLHLPLLPPPSLASPKVEWQGLAVVRKGAGLMGEGEGRTRPHKGFACGFSRPCRSRKRTAALREWGDCARLPTPELPTTTRSQQRSNHPLPHSLPYIHSPLRTRTRKESAGM
ncbi:hypothetical protein GGG16DRAFT_119803 [Schizophyllum commune]